MTYLNRRTALAGLGAMFLPSVTLAGDEEHRMVVTKTPSCGCCTAWAEIARAEGFAVEIVENADYVGTKRAHGVPDDLWSCHSTRVGGYVVEGHVPIEAVRRLLAERPDVAGIAVPGMPAGSPGMGDDPTARFDVLSFGGAAEAGEVFYKAGE
ncbi:CopG family transcriptional regulator [Roseovarius sp. SCSIO 43702]|uniref:DUF411 domain-containing protein n=1 Tax=Roseovarius sp. SCSIO 43702 TaxID=2823043 RepID=UPI001C738598|nr:DUF411 domain-containing protein [Roseovarius sp. SCSIO 43702]QYX55301.1 CopG family transcriptional regulator [Roseovarius sp. SCSIO 43702]